MISSLALKGLRQSPLFGYAADLPAFKAKRSITFKPGLNILFGPNGCGKSTVLKILGDTMLATTGGVSAVTESSIRATTDYKFGRETKPKIIDTIGLELIHDGQPVVYCDPRQAVGLHGGSLDQAFFKENLQDVLTRSSASHGQLSSTRIAVALDILEGKTRPPEKPIVKFRREDVSDMWQKAIELAEERMKPRIEKGQITVLLDEPEANFSLQWQGMLWTILADPRVAERCQVIVASHSPFALGLPNANYIDLLPGYREELQTMLTRHFANSPQA